MATSTTNLKLYKYNTATDGTSVFSIENALNANWDRIDNFAATCANKSLSNLDTTGENRFTNIWTELNKKLEAEVSLSENGYIKFNKFKSGGSNTLKMYWGVTSTVTVAKGKTGSRTANFPTSFFSNVYYASVCMDRYTATMATSGGVWTWLGSVSTTQIVGEAYVTSEANSSKTFRFKFLAIGI